MAPPVCSCRERPKSTSCWQQSWPCWTHYQSCCRNAASPLRESASPRANPSPTGKLLFTLSPEPSLLYATSYKHLSQDRRCGAQTGSQGQPPVQSQQGRCHRAAGEFWQRQTEQHQELHQCRRQRMRLGRRAVAIHFQFLLTFSKMFACLNYFNFSNSSNF